MKYDHKTGCAYPSELNYQNLPETIVEVSEEDHLKILQREISDAYKVNKDGTVTIIKGEENGNSIG